VAPRVDGFGLALVSTEAGAPLLPGRVTILLPSALAVIGKEPLRFLAEEQESCRCHDLLAEKQQDAEREHRGQTGGYANVKSREAPTPLASLTPRSEGSGLTMTIASTRL